jgi:hypothetical protein
MTSSIPNREKIDRIVQSILQTPTPENSQPWKIVVSENVLKVFHSSERAKLATFPDDLSVLGIGMIAETLELACSSEGLEARLTFLLEERSDEHPWLRAELNTVDNISPDPLAQALLWRNCDRRYYAGGSLDDPVFQEIDQEAAAIQGANLYFTDKYPDEYLQLLKNADQIAIDWQEYSDDMAKWLRFTDKEIKKTRDGMSWRTLLRGNPNGLYYLRSRLWWLATRFDGFPQSLQKLESYFFDDSWDLSPSSYDDGAGIGCITTLSTSVEDLVAAGGLTLSLWLLLNLRHYGFQPLTNLPAIIYPQRLGTFKLPNDLNHLVANGYETLQQVFGFSESELPIFCFRTGRAKGEYPAIARTLRRTDHVSYR